MATRVRHVAWQLTFDTIGAAQHSVGFLLAIVKCHHPGKAIQVIGHGGTVLAFQLFIGGEQLTIESLCPVIIFQLDIEIDLPATSAKQGQEREYFVSSTKGSDRGDGSRNAPWRRIQTAAERAKPGSVVNVEKGIYRETVDIKVSGNSVDGPIKFRSVGGGPAVIDLSASTCNVDADAAISIRNGSHLTIEGFEIDLKPSNILLTNPDAKKKHVFILDFGLAKFTDNHPTKDHTLTRPGQLLGTPEYMSPEQARGGQCDERSDIYSLGCILFEMAVGKPPFEAAALLEVVRMQCEDRSYPYLSCPGV